MVNEKNTFGKQCYDVQVKLNFDLLIMLTCDYNLRTKMCKTKFTINVWTPELWIKNDIWTLNSKIWINLIESSSTVSIKHKNHQP